MSSTRALGLAVFLALMTGCGVQATSLHQCTGDEVALVLSCGHKSAPEEDIDGRRLVTCRIGATASDECLLEGDDYRYHCMPAEYCETLCGTSDFVCE